jgi:type IV pilus assembly protein PilB
VPQDGKIITKVGEEEVDLRVSILPVVNGEKVVIRILDRKSYKVGKEKLGLSPENLRKLENIISNPNGIMLVTGPTGSGKSTTLYTILSELNSDKVNIITIEDPVEYTLNGINQVNVILGIVKKGDFTNIALFIPVK